MIFRIIETNRTVWFPIANLNNASESYLSILGVEILLSVFCVFVSVRCVRVLLLTGVIHLNMGIVLSALWIQWFEVFIAKIIMSPYQYGFWKIDDSIISISSWWTSDVSEVIPVKNFQSILPLYISALLLWHCTLTLFLGLGGIVFERLFATYYVKDYEQKSRKWIPVLLISFNQILSIPMSFLFIEYQFSVGFLIGIIVILMPAFSIAYVFVLKLNKHLQTYSLSQKFQIRENLRALVMLRNFIRAELIYTLVTCTLFYLLVFKYIDNYSGILNRVLENIIYLNPIFAGFAIMYCSDVWWQEFIGFHLIKRKERRIKVVPDETNVYFGQLKAAWA